jgi:hypothetical protein
MPIASSGRLVPSETIVRPITIGRMPRREASAVLPRTSSSAPTSSPASQATSVAWSFSNSIGVRQPTCRLLSAGCRGFAACSPPAGVGEVVVRNDLGTVGVDPSPVNGAIVKTRHVGAPG